MLTIPLYHQQQHQQQARPLTPTHLKQFPLSSPPTPTHRRDKVGVDFPQAEQPDTVKRSRTRPPSLRSFQARGDPSKMVRPHPLIRRPSSMTSTSPNPNATNTESSNGSPRQNGVSTVAFGSGIGKLAPLTTITAVPSVSSPSPSSSPVSAKHGKEEVEVKERLRRQSIASLSSVNTQRSLGRAAGHEYGNQASGIRLPRERTLSALSSPYAALSALYPSHNQQSTSFYHSLKSPGGPSHQPGPTYGFTSYFPSTESDDSGPTASELMHILLPAPYLSAHMTVLKGRSPIREAVERVSRAKKAQSSQ